jgi:hypothetical protein
MTTDCSNPEQYPHRLRKKYKQSLFHRTPDNIKNTESLVLTIDTRIDTNNNDTNNCDREVDRPSFLDKDSNFAKNNSLISIVYIIQEMFRPMTVRRVNQSINNMQKNQYLVQVLTTLKEDF